jgi:hypothetical protein
MCSLSLSALTLENLKKVWTAAIGCQEEEVVVLVEQVVVEEEECGKSQMSARCLTSSLMSGSVCANWQ